MARFSVDPRSSPSSGDRHPRRASNGFERQIVAEVGEPQLIPGCHYLVDSAQFSTRCEIGTCAAALSLEMVWRRRLKSVGVPFCGPFQRDDGERWCRGSHERRRTAGRLE